ncbi:pilus assembly PilX N-terminal domain-containing protein [Shewanella sp.]|nr:pilus assembly PilX N-terminal domain-containing protein [Shewanella sp.]
MKKQNGMVLFFSLIVLVIMTLIGVALATNSSMSMKMAGAGAQRVAAKITANGALDKVIDEHKGRSFANMSATTESHLMGGRQWIEPEVEDVNCQRRSNANSAGLIRCRRSDVFSSASFGKSDIGNLTVVAGVEQEVL